MELRVAPDIWQAFPGLQLAAAVAHGVRNVDPTGVVAAAWAEAWRAAAEDARPYGNAQSHPRIRPWRERMRGVGVSKEFPSSIEAMVRRTLKGGEPFVINPLVDFYNTVSLRHTVPAGGFDLGEVDGPIELRFTRPGDTFLSLDAEAPIPVDPGEVAYTVGATVLTRHFVWRQSRQALIEPSSTSILLVSEILGEVGDDAARAALADFTGGLGTSFGVSSRSFLLGREESVAAW